MNFPDMAEKDLRKDKQALLLIGDGGLGKTTGMLELYRRLLHHPIAENGKSLIPIYIPLALCPVAGRNSILHYVQSRMTTMKFDAAQDADIHIDNMKTMMQHDERFQYVFLLDACNECSRFLDFVPEIQELKSLNAVSVILSSRETPVSFQDWNTYCVQPLDRELVRETLEKNGVGSVTDGMLELLTNPFYLTRYLSMLQDPELDTQRELNRYSLLERYTEWSVRKRDPANAEALLKRIYGSAAPLAFSQAAICHSMSFVGDNQDGICEGLLRPLGLVKDDSRAGVSRYFFSHQINRDFLAASWLVRHYICSNGGGKVFFSLLSQELPQNVIGLFADFLRSQGEGLPGCLQRLNEKISASEALRQDALLQKNLITLWAEAGQTMERVELRDRNLTRASFVPFTKLLDVDFRGSSFTPEAFSFPAETERFGSGQWAVFPERKLLVMFNGNRIWGLNSETGETEYVGEHMPKPDLFAKVDEDRILLSWIRGLDTARFVLIKVGEWTQSGINMNGIPEDVFSDWSEFEIEERTQIVFFADNKIYLKLEKDTECLHVFDIDQGYLGQIESTYLGEDILLFINGGSELAPGRDTVTLCQKDIYCCKNCAAHFYHQPIIVFLPSELFKQECSAWRQPRIAPHSPEWYKLLMNESIKWKCSYSPWSNLSEYEGQRLIGWYQEQTGQNQVLYVGENGSVRIGTVDMETFQINPDSWDFPNIQMEAILLKDGYFLAGSNDQIYIVDLKNQRVISLLERLTLNPENEYDAVLDIELSPDRRYLYCWLRNSVACLDYRTETVCWRKESLSVWMDKNFNYDMCRAYKSLPLDTVVLYTSRTDGSIFEFRRKLQEKSFHMTGLYHKDNAGASHDDIMFHTAAELEYYCLTSVKQIQAVPACTCVISRTAEKHPIYTIQKILETGTGIQKSEFQLPKADYLGVDFVGDEIWAVSKEQITAFSCQGERLWDHQITYQFTDGKYQCVRAAFGEVCGYQGVFILDHPDAEERYIIYILRDPDTGEIAEYQYYYDDSEEWDGMLDITSGPQPDEVAIVGLKGEVRLFHSEKSGGGFTVREESYPCQEPFHHPMIIRGQSVVFSEVQGDCMDEYSFADGALKTWYPFCHEVTGSKFEGCTGFSEKEKTILQQYGAESI